MFHSAKTLQTELAEHFHRVHPQEAFASEQSAALLADLVSLLGQKLNRDTWTHMGFVNTLIHHLAGEHLQGDVFIRAVADIKLNLQGTWRERISAYAIDFVAPVTGRPYRRPPLRLQSIS